MGRRQVWRAEGKLGRPEAFAVHVNGSSAMAIDKGQGPSVQQWNVTCGHGAKKGIEAFRAFRKRATETYITVLDGSSGKTRGGQHNRDQVLA